MTNCEKELWLCEFHDAFERGDFDVASKMFWKLSTNERMSLCKTDLLLRERLVEILTKGK